MPSEELLPTARELAREIAANAAHVSIAVTRQMLWRMLGADDPIDAHKIDSRAMYFRGATANVREGVTAFLEKRPAAFTDKVSENMPPYFPWWQERDFT